MSTQLEIQEKFVKGQFLTQGEILILSILSEKPNYPYEIQKVMEDRQTQNWMKVGFSSIYHALERLEKRHLVKSSYHIPETKEETKSKRKQRFFSLTEKGSNLLKESSAFLISQYIDKSPSSIGITNLNLFTLEEAQVLFRIRKERIDQRITTILKQQENIKNRLEMLKKEERLVIELLFEYTLMKHEAEQMFIKKVNEKWLNQQKIL